MCKKVYVITSGSYSDYRIEGVFLDKDKAERSANFITYSQVEEFVVGEIGGFLPRGYVASIWFNQGPEPEFRVELAFYEEIENPIRIVDREHGRWESICLEDFKPDDNVVSVKAYGKTEEVALKSVRDLWSRIRCIQEGI